MQPPAEHLDREDFQKLAFEAAPDAIVISRFEAGSSQAFVTHVNPAFTRVSGFAADEVIGRTNELTPDPNLRRFQGVRHSKNGQTYAVDVSTCVAEAQDGSVIHIAIERPAGISEETLLEEKRRLEKKVEERTADLEGFTYSVAHDLRAPLRAILASSMVLLEDYSEQLPLEAQQELERQSKAAKRLNRLVEELLKHSRIARDEFEKKELDMSRLAQDCTRELVALGACEEHAVQVQPSMTGCGDLALMRLVYQNLIQNACKFAKPGERPRIEVGQDVQGFFVRDYGRGFPKQAADRIFRPFERLVRDSDVPGTGIGLANVKRVIERHGGRIWAEGEKDVGATIRFWLPDR